LFFGRVHSLNSQLYVFPVSAPSLLERVGERIYFNLFSIK
jgi:hypothetical protein